MCGAGISGFFDHLVAHAVVKRAYVELCERVDYLTRLAFYTITEEEAAQFEWVHLTDSKPEDIDVVVPLDEVDVEAMRRALDCYVTYAETIETSGIKRDIAREAAFEIYQEAHDPALSRLVRIDRDGVDGLGRGGRLPDDKDEKSHALFVIQIGRVVPGRRDIGLPVAFRVNVGAENRAKGPLSQMNSSKAGHWRPLQ